MKEGAPTRELCAAQARAGARVLAADAKGLASAVDACNRARVRLGRVRPERIHVAGSGASGACHECWSAMPRAIGRQSAQLPSRTRVQHPHDHLALERLRHGLLAHVGHGPERVAHVARYESVHAASALGALGAREAAEGGGTCSA